MSARRRSALFVLALLASAGTGCGGTVPRDVGAGGAGPGGSAGGGGGNSSGGATGVGGGSDGGLTDGGVSLTDGGALYAWTDLSPCHFPATVPSGRTDPMAAFDSDRRKLIAYGGSGGNYSDLWEVDLATGLRTDRTTCASVGVVPNYGSALVYDAGRKRLVLFPYNGVSNVSEWDPLTDVWTDRPAPLGNTVPAGEGRTALYDPIDGRVIVFITHVDMSSGALSVWAWDGATGAWTPLADPFPVSDSIEQPSVAFDADRDVVWGFGGNDTGTIPLDDLWSWNVATNVFTDLTPATRPAAWPPARDAEGIAYDETRGKLVVYGGWAGSTPRRDIWEWDPVAATWTDRTASGVSPTGTDPPAVTWPASDYWSDSHLYADPAHGGLVLLQVPNLESTGHSGAWLWNGARGTWTEPSANTPPALWPSTAGGSTSAVWDDGDQALYVAQQGQLWRWTAGDGVWTALAQSNGQGAPNSLPSLYGGAIAYDPKARAIVLFGGNTITNGTTPGTMTNDLWRWDLATSQLSRLSPPSGAAWPEPRTGHAMAYDPVRQQVLLFGGGKPEPSHELWALDTASATWTDLSGGATSTGAAWPEARIGPQLALDPVRQVLVLTGGGDTSASPVQALASTWELAAGTTSWNERARASSASLVGEPLAFVSGVGLVTLSSAWDPNATYLGLWRWDGAGAAWTSLGVDAPVTPVGGELGGLVGAGGRLLMLWAPGFTTAVPTEDASFFHLWQWGTK